MLLSSTIVLAQNAGNLLAGKDLSTIKVDALTDAELGQIQAQLKQSGVSIDMVKQSKKPRIMRRIALSKTFLLNLKLTL